MTYHSYAVYSFTRQSHVGDSAKIEWAGFPFYGWWDENLPQGTGWQTYLARYATILVD